MASDKAFEAEVAARAEAQSKHLLRLYRQRVARRKAARPDTTWGRIHQHEVNGRTVSCNDGTNCRKAR